MVGVGAASAAILRRRRSIARAATLAAITAGLLLSAGTLAQQPATELTGDAARGATLYTDAYKCYACHGYDAQSTENRLKPMRFDQRAFITFVRNSPLPLMPSYPDVPTQDLADMHAYIVSIPVDAPEVSELTLLREIRERQREAAE